MYTKEMKEICSYFHRTGKPPASRELSKTFDVKIGKTEHSIQVEYTMEAGEQETGSTYYNEINKIFLNGIDITECIDVIEILTGLEIRHEIETKSL